MDNTLIETLSPFESFTKGLENKKGPNSDLCLSQVTLHIDECKRRINVKHVFINLLIAIALFIVLILISEIVLPSSDDMIINRMISGFIGMLSILLARFIVKKMIRKKDVQETG